MISVTMWLLGGGIEEVGLQINKIGLFRAGHSASVLTPEKLKLLKNLLHIKIFNGDLVLQGHSYHAPEKAARIHCLLMQSGFCISVHEFSLSMNVSHSYSFLSLHT